MKIITILLSMMLSICSFTYAAIHWYSPWGNEEAPPKVRISANTETDLIIEVEIYGFYLEDVDTEAGIFQRLRLSERVESVCGEIGSPEIPQLSKLIEIPHSAVCKISQISQNDVYTVENICPYPRQEPLVDGEEPGNFIYHRSNYSHSALLPEKQAEIENVGVWRNLRVGSLRIRPIRYSARDNTLQIARRMTIEISFISGMSPPFPTPAGKIPPIFDKMYRGSVLNYDPQRHQLDETDEVVGTKYIVICEHRAVNGIQPLVDFRNAQGYRTELLTPDSSFSTPLEFKQYISELYLSDGLEYLLLVGNPYIGTGTPAVPMYYWDFNPQNPSYSDSWYSCLVPGGDNDHYPEIAVGRITYDNLTELDRIVAKTMNYLTEYDVSEDWFERSLLVAHMEEYPQKYTQCKEEIRTWNYTIQTPVFTTIYGGEGGNNSDIVDYINNGSCGLFNYRGHGSETTWPAWGWGGSFSAYWVSQFNNQNRLFIIFDVCCSNNNVVTYNGECLAESFMQADFGAAAIHAAIDPSYTDPNHKFDREFYKAIFDQGIYSIGYASNYAHMETMDDFGGIGQDNFRMYFWQGDPAIDLWTHIPQIVNVEYPDSLIVGSQTFTVNVSSSGSPIEGAMVCIQNEEIYQVAYTDSDGNAIIIFDPPLLEQGEAMVTVSGHNVAFRSDTLSIGGGYGAIEGIVTSNSTAEPLIQASIRIPQFDYDTETDSFGYYHFEDVPAFVSFDVEANYPGYIASVAEGMSILEGEVLTLDFSLLHSEFNPSVEEITTYVDVGGSGSFDFSVMNEGDGPLEYSAEITGENSGPNLYTRYYFNASSAAEDDELYGIAFDGESFWVSGAGDAENNWIYKFNLEGELIGYIPQPESITENGFYDLCWDGEYLYASEGTDIICFDREGEYIYTIPTTMDPVKAIAFDPQSGHFFIGGGNADIREIDSLGTVIDTYNHDFNITGLAWDENDEDNMNLYILSAEPMVTISKLSVIDRTITTVGNIFGMPDNTSGGCLITEEVDVQYKLLIGLYKSSQADKVKGWQLDRLFDYFSLVPMNGSIEPAESQQFTLYFDAAELDSAVYDAILRFAHNGLSGENDIPVYLYVGVSGICCPEYGNSLPHRFVLHPNYPNPFNPSTTIAFALPEAAKVRLSVYDILGRTVIDEDLGLLNAGEYDYEFNGKDLASGIYFYRLQAGNFIQTRKMLMLK